MRLTEVQEEFRVPRRTAQRMTVALEEAFPRTETTVDFDQHKIWRIKSKSAIELNGIDAGDLAALQTGPAQLRQVGDNNTEDAVSRLHEKVSAQMPDREALRADTDADAVLETLGFAARPGPRSPVDPEIVKAIPARHSDHNGNTQAPDGRGLGSGASTDGRSQRLLGSRVPDQ